MNKENKDVKMNTIQAVKKPFINKFELLIIPIIIAYRLPWLFQHVNEKNLLVTALISFVIVSVHFIIYKNKILTTYKSSLHRIIYNRA